MRPQLSLSGSALLLLGLLGCDADEEGGGNRGEDTTPTDTVEGDGGAEDTRDEDSGVTDFGPDTDDTAVDLPPPDVAPDDGADAPPDIPNDPDLSDGTGADAADAPPDVNRDAPEEVADLPADAFDADASAPPPWWTCEEPSHCGIQSSGCCDPCGQPELDQVDAVNVELREEHHQDVCTEPDPICPRCATQLNPSLVATCEENRCTAHDVRLEAWSECTTDEDCVVRVPDCCPCGADTSVWNLLALRGDRVAEYASAICDSEHACLECEPVYPPEALAACGEGGHCVVVLR